MADFAIEGDAIRCLESDRGTKAPGRIATGPQGCTIENGPSIEGLGLAGLEAPSREALIETLVERGHIVHGT